MISSDSTLRRVKLKRSSFPVGFSAEGAAVVASKVDYDES